MPTIFFTLSSLVTPVKGGCTIYGMVVGAEYVYVGITGTYYAIEEVYYYAGAASGVGDPCIKLRTSSLVTRPSLPVPGILLISNPFAFAKDRTAGVERAFD